NPANPFTLTGVANIAAIPVGARISGTGVGREIYVAGRNIGAGTITLSDPLWGGAATRNFTFRRYKYMLDFSGFDELSKFEITDIEFNCAQTCSAILLAKTGKLFRISDCTFTTPKDRGVTSYKEGCQGIVIESCQFNSWEFTLTAQNRSTVGFNVNANDAKIRNNRAAYFAHFGVLAGGSHIILGNHMFSEDEEPLGARRAGLVFTARNVRGFVVGNYIDNCFIELSNERDPDPDFGSGYTFGGMAITGNLFLCSNTNPGFRFLVLSPKGSGHSIAGLSVTGNVFRNSTNSIDRVEDVDTSEATLNTGSYRNLVFANNTFNGVSQATVSPMLVEHSQNTAADTWVVDATDYLPFTGRARNVESLVLEGPLRNASNAVQWAQPYVEVEQGVGNRMVNLKWPSPVKGKALVTVRCDNPL
ncbi:MAG: right-handed parallel beta-helix repeat-containing protein, partial [Rhodobacteraceae bacterium]|nr:right-handed parallel beta-helix repeat-containing protein [Paracoccaceae bacterium]